jgi:hypothetical protein
MGSNPLAHEKIRLDIIYKILNEALKERPSHVVSINGEAQLVEKQDLGSALKAVEMARKEMDEYTKKKNEERLASRQNNRNTAPKKPEVPLAEEPPKTEDQEDQNEDRWTWE